MTFEEALAYLDRTIAESVSRREPYRLDRMRAFLQALGNPQNSYPTLHVGGTSGKGSTSTMLAAILQADGKRVGLHTKPHVRSITERASISGIAITPEHFAALLADMMPVIESVAQTAGRPSYYETVLALAFLYFARERVDSAVIEVGIGGKLDGTNVIVPEVSVITTIGYDHMDVLGDTLEAIAADKAGIAKPGIPLVSAVADSSARAVIERRCREVGSPFVSVLDTVHIETLPAGANGNPHTQRFRLVTPLRSYVIELPMLGAFQRVNAATAVRAIELMPSSVGSSAVERGLANVALPGRMEYFPGHPGVIFDIAHNPEKAANLTQALTDYFSGKHITFVVAIGETKDAHEILRALRSSDEPNTSQTSKTFIFTTFTAAGKHPTDPERLAKLIEELGGRGRVIQDPVEALRVARRETAPDDIVVVTGSTFIVAELRERRASYA